MIVAARPASYCVVAEQEYVADVVVGNAAVAAANADSLAIDSCPGQSSRCGASNRQSRQVEYCPFPVQGTKKGVSEEATRDIE